MQSNQFVLVNMAGGTRGGTYRLRADGRLPLRAVAWRTLRDEALDQCVSVLDLV